MKKGGFLERDAADFARSVEPALQINMSMAAKSQIAALHKQMLAWCKSRPWTNGRG